MLAHAITAIMTDTNSASDQSLLWGWTVEFWDRVGIWSLIFGAILGVIALLLAAASAYILYRVADIAQVELVSATKRSAADLGIAQADIEKSKAQIAQANERAAQATQKANEAALALENFKAPRAISIQQRNRIAEEMKQFSGQEYFGLIASDVADAWEIWREISLSLELAGWKRLPVPGLSAAQFGPPAGIALAPLAGVMILTSTTNDPPENIRLHELAKALATKLTDESIIAGAGFTDAKYPNAITIVIGPKP